MSLSLPGEFLMVFQTDGKLLNPAESSTEVIAFWVGCFLLAGGACIYGLGFRSAKREHWEEFYLNNFMICSWAACAYLAMAMHLGEITLPATGVDTERHIYWARYADWLFTTPIIIYDLTKLSGVRSTVKKAAMYADIDMIFAGFFCSYLSPRPKNGMVHCQLSV
ncbi:MAG: bacteriorhodopsin [Rhizonema sp. PD38]|nr:bacteriorhodopsin [Rhizonema sp. PD38]